MGQIRYTSIPPCQREMAMKYCVKRFTLHVCQWCVHQVYCRSLTSLEDRNHHSEMEVSYCRIVDGSFK